MCDDLFLDGMLVVMFDVYVVLLGCLVDDVVWWLCEGDIVLLFVVFVVDVYLDVDMYIVVGFVV